ncbi:hypothetical protein BEWA_013920 [Theileria equi strain WA]|uniref:Uncharacterized protein n=1 Tax=Theileria equi strain WA TaxID=1537102 RepID=L1LCF5_THEEQ|nr:hypothetical protein BEWA_013920 [Theileria equi strain WA]EKX72833.1 hypothetical protein BEWA_013920 [Theileria equi strain WA]|eukprot:XP_004832285.1 hypothetical protein BEWA_013920 [Theileria equi strain WA]
MFYVLFNSTSGSINSWHWSVLVASSRVSMVLVETPSVVGGSRETLQVSRRCFRM